MNGRDSFGSGNPVPTSGKADAHVGRRGGGRRGGRQRMRRGSDRVKQLDQDVFQFLLHHHQQIRRIVRRLANGVKTLTESDQPELIGRIQDHAKAMHRRIRSGIGLRFRDDLFTEIFRWHSSISMTVEDVDRGVLVRETSDDPYVVSLIQAHADVVSQFVASGITEATMQHAVPRFSQH